MQICQYPIHGGSGFGAKAAYLSKAKSINVSDKNELQSWPMQYTPANVDHVIIKAHFKHTAYICPTKLISTTLFLP